MKGGVNDITSEVRQILRVRMGVEARITNVVRTGRARP